MPRCYNEAVAGGQEEPLFSPDPGFAEQWAVEDPLAQGALKYGAVKVLDLLREAVDELSAPRSDLGDFGPLGLFPAGLRPALTPLMVEKLYVAAVVVGWKLAQPGPPLVPVSLGEELALELIRREAVSGLELIGADRASIASTRGLYEICEDDDVLDLFAMREPADAAVARESPVNQMMGKADMRVERWFDVFYGGGRGALHPFCLEAEAGPAVTRADMTIPLEPVEPTTALPLDRESSRSEFRVILRFWEDAFLDRHPTSQMPSTWVYHLQAETAESALQEALGRFPNGTTRELDHEQAEEARLDREDLARISIDVQRVNLPQSFSDGVAFHVVGSLSQALSTEQLSQLAANLHEAFPEAVVLGDGERAYYGISVNAETHEEADMSVEEFLFAFGEAAGLSEEPSDGMSVGQGARRHDELVEEVEKYRQSESRR